MTTTEHAVAPEEIMAYLDGELSVFAAKAVSDHLEHCAACAALAEEFGNLSQTLAGWSVPAVPLRLERSMRESMDKVGHGEKRSTGLFRGGFGNWRLWAMGSGAAAAIFLAVMMVSTISRRSPSVPESVVLSELSADSATAQRKTYFNAPARVDKQQSVAAMRRNELAATDRLVGDKDVPLESPSYWSDDAKESKSPIAITSPMIARTVSLTILVNSVDASRASLDLLLAQHHGYSAQISTNTREGAPRDLQASLRIPAQELGTALAGLKALGRIQYETQSGEEVTQQHVDLAARLQTARATEERFRDILQKRTGSVADVLEVEEGIARVRGEIEEMEAEQKTLEHRVDYATVDLQLTEPYKAQLHLQEDSFGSRARNAFVAGYRNAEETTIGLLCFVEEYGPSLLVCVLLLGLPIFLVWRRYRRMRRSL